MKLINQSASTASRMSGWAVALLLGAFLLGGSTTDATAAAQAPYIGSFTDTGYSASDHYYTPTNHFQCKVWQIQLGTPSIYCDKIYWSVQLGEDLIESLTSYGPSTGDEWVLTDSGTGGSTREFWVKAAYSSTNSYYNSYYLSYEDSPYSRCWEQDGYVGIYNP